MKLMESAVDKLSKLVFWHLVFSSQTRPKTCVLPKQGQRIKLVESAPTAKRWKVTDQSRQIMRVSTVDPEALCTV